MGDADRARVPEVSPPTIALAGLTRRFGEFTAVDAVDLEVRAGELFGLLGSNGAGKTTTLRILTTLLKPTAGSARVAGHDVVTSPREVRKRIGYVPQLLSADAALTARENLTLMARLYGIPRAERPARIEASLAFMELAEVGDALVKTYSGGMIRRLEIAQSMLHGPRVLFLDEPTVGLDPVARRAVWERLQGLRAQTGATVLLTTHDMEEAATLCERIGLMHRGKLVALGTPEELRSAVGPEATLDDVFIHYTGGGGEPSGSYRDVARTRKTANRLG